METENLSDKVNESPIGFINPAFDEAQLKDVQSEEVDDGNAEIKEEVDDETWEDTQEQTEGQTEIDKHFKETENNEIKAKEENGRKRAKSEDKSITGDVSLSSVDMDESENGKTTKPETTLKSNMT